MILEKLRAVTLKILNKIIFHSIIFMKQGFVKDVEVRLIDKTRASDSGKREFCWMRTLKTLYPDGLNIESDY